MGVRRFDIEAGGDAFQFAAETEPKVAFWLAKYPEVRKRSAVIPLLWLAQKDNAGWLSEPAMRAVADRLEMPYIRVYEVATFYTMFRLQPVGKFHVQLCGTTPCMLRGANDLKDVAKRVIGEKMHITDDLKLSWEEVECLGACVNAPMVQINDYYYEDLTPESFGDILGKLQNGVAVEPGTFVERLNSAPEGGLTSLTSADLFDGSRIISELPNTGDPVEEEAAPAPKEPPPEPKKTTLIDAAKPAADAEPEGERPEAFDPSTGDADDLKRIKGIGPKNEEALNALGIYKFSQIAVWTPENIAWVEGSLSFPGRIQRENWIAQAIELAQGGETEFSKRVDKGEVASSKSEGDS
ncbi:MAG: NADH-quinone oxidoreductase subunit NuoE [Hyphomonadaceae bacterium]